MEMRNQIYIFLLILLVQTSCNKESAPDCFKSAGKEVTIRRSTGVFENLELEDYIHIELVDSSDYAVELIGPSNVLPKIFTEVSGNTLYIRNENTCNFVRSFKKTVTVRIYAPSISHIENRGTGDIRSVGTLYQDYLKLENRHASGTINISFEGDSVAIYTHTGVSDVFLSGNALKCELFNQGIGVIDAREMRVEQAFLNNSSINSIYAFSSNYLFSGINFSGNNYVYGHPTLIDEEDSAEGELVLSN
jgi:hypothetical protein